jgi:transposase
MGDPLTEQLAEIELSDLRPGPKTPVSADSDRLRGVKAMQLRTAGLTYQQIADRLGCGAAAARDMVKRALARAERLEVKDLRELENTRLDQAQAAIWARVLRGDLAAMDRFLRISERRARLNGLDAPTAVNISLGVRAEMEQALAELSTVIEGEVEEQPDDGDDG